MNNSFADQQLALISHFVTAKYFTLFFTNNTQHKHKPENPYGRQGFDK